jgi:hypothetical protein
MAAPQNNNTTAGAIDQADIDDWVARFNGALADSKTVTAPAAADAAPWYNSFFGCFTPIDTCKETHIAHL